jgi:hypothetical protein
MCPSNLFSFVLLYLLVWGLVGLAYYLTLNKPDWKGFNDLAEGFVGIGLFGLFYVVGTVLYCMYRG